MLVLIPFSYYILPRLNKFLSNSQEFLFLFAISFGLGLASLFYIIGFSIEAGALIAGIILSITPYSYEVSAKLKPLRDFFIISFFLILGSQMIFSEINNLLIPAVLFSLFIFFVLYKGRKRIISTIKNILPFAFWFSLPIVAVSIFFVLHNVFPYFY